MSELKLSTDLVQQLLDVLEAHDDAATNPHVASQYLCAVVGFLVGQHDMTPERREEALDELSGFTRHVANDVSSQSKQPPPPPPQEAFGIWKPKA